MFFIVSDLLKFQINCKISLKEYINDNIRYIHVILSVHHKNLGFYIRIIVESEEKQIQNKKQKKINKKILKGKAR